MKYGSNLRTLRKSKDIPIKQMAVVLKMSTTNYNKVEKEKIRLSEENLKRAAEELGVSVETIKELPKNLIGHGHHNQQAENANFVVHPAPDKIIALLEATITSLQAENAYLRATNELLINKFVDRM